MKLFSTTIAILFAGGALVSAFPAASDDDITTHNAASTPIHTHAPGKHVHHATTEADATTADAATVQAETTPACATEPATPTAVLGGMPTDTDENLRVTGPAFPTEILNPSTTEYSPAKGRSLAKKGKSNSVQKVNDAHTKDQFVGAHSFEILPHPKHEDNTGTVTGSVGRKRRQEVVDPIMYANYAELEKKNRFPDSEHGHKITYDADVDRRR